MNVSEIYRLLDAIEEYNYMPKFIEVCSCDEKRSCTRCLRAERALNIIDNIRDSITFMFYWRYVYDQFGYEFEHLHYFINEKFKKKWIND